MKRVVFSRLLLGLAIAFAAVSRPAALVPAASQGQAEHSLTASDFGSTPFVVRTHSSAALSWLGTNARARVDASRSTLGYSSAHSSCGTRATALAASYSVLDVVPDLAACKSGRAAHSTSAIPPPIA